MTLTMEYVKDSRDQFKTGRSWLKKIGRGLLIILVAAATVLLATALSGALTAVSDNIQITGGRIFFDPQTTLVYLVVSYLAGYFYALTKKQQYNLFLLALLLSFTVNFIQGALALVILPPFLKKLKLISTPDTYG